MLKENTGEKHSRNITLRILGGDGEWRSYKDKKWDVQENTVTHKGKTYIVTKESITRIPTLSKKMGLSSSTKICAHYIENCPLPLLFDEEEAKITVEMNKEANGTVTVMEMPVKVDTAVDLHNWKHEKITRNLIRATQQENIHEWIRTALWVGGILAAIIIICLFLVLMKMGLLDTATWTDRSSGT